MEQTFKFSAIGLALVAIALLSGCKSGYNQIYSNSSSSSSSSSNSSNSAVSSTSSSNTPASSSTEATSSSTASLSSATSSSAPASQPLGKATFDSMCDSCHTTVDALASHTKGAGLASFISANMPKSDPSLCTDSDNCATNLAGYINGYSVETLANCAEGTAPASNKTTIFEDQGDLVSILTGWSHITIPAPNGLLIPPAPDPLYSSLVPASSNPVYDASNIVKTSDDSCSNATTGHVILVKKIGDWDKQHSNGFAVSLTDKNKTFSDVEAIHLEFKINSANTVLPSKELLMTTYPQLSATQIAQLDSNKANLVVSLSDKGSSDGNTDGQMERFIEVDPTDFDKWLKVTIPASQMYFFTVASYAKNPSDQATLASNLVDDLLISPETYGNRRKAADLGTFGNVVRHFDADNYSPELFKQIDITIKKIEVEWTN